MRDWHLTADSPLAMRFAADVRLGRTDYADDQSWEAVFGGPQEPGLAFQTRYGGRAGLARLVPMWIIEGRPVYEGASLAGKPVLQRFAPNYAKISIQLLNTLTVTAELWVMESHAVGGRFVMENSADAPVSLEIQLFAQVVTEGEVLDMNLLALDNGAEALHLGEVGNLNPVLMMDYAVQASVPAGERRSPKLSAPITIPAKGWSTVRWLHAGNATVKDSLQTAFRWLYQANWDESLAQIERINDPLPVIETGNTDWDAAIAFSQQILLRSFVGPTGAMPYPSYVNARIPSRGYSPHGDGSDHSAQWSGQTAALGYLALPATAIVAPNLAKGAVKNALAVQNPDGWIDFKPGLGGQRANLLSAPLWATTAWRIYEITEDKQFIADVFDGLRRFFERWFQPDMDRDQDGLPEWTTAAQSGHSANPTFARFLRGSQNADISKAETPDLAAYLISEGINLLNMAELLGNTDTASIQARIEPLRKHLDAMWNEAAGSYQYRDRDTDQTVAGKTLFRGKGDSAFDTRATLDPANRLILRVVGGKDHPPRMSAAIEGVDFKGAHVSETLPASAFAWNYGMGAAVSERVYSQVNYVKFEGLSRVYSVEIDTVDLTQHSLPQLLPLWAVSLDGLGTVRSEKITETVTNSARYWRKFGLPVIPGDDPAFGVADDISSQSVWLLWNTMILEGLNFNSFSITIEAEHDLFARIMTAQVNALKRYHAFRESYDSETGEGMGDLDELAGIVPLHLLRLFSGIYIMNTRSVDIRRPLVLPLKVTQYGVEVSRSATSIVVRFPSGYTTEVQNGPLGALIVDPTPLPVVPAPEPSAPEAVQPAAPDEPPVPPEPATDQPAAMPAGEPVPPVSPPSPAAIIPVDSKKDDTLDIPISQIDFTPKDKPDTGPGIIKIPVHGSDE